MILIILIGIYLLGGLLAWLFSGWNIVPARWVALTASVFNLILVLFIWLDQDGIIVSGSSFQWIIEIRKPWIERFGIYFHLDPAR
jgi:NADH:ubiquinone oxidoreductase subunit 4 (subunit M)